MVKASYVPRPGDIVWLNFSPQAGHEQYGSRPGFVISQNFFNRRTGFAWICPVTNQVKGYPFEVSLPIELKTQGAILADQLRSLDFQARQITFIEVTPPDIIQKVLQRIRPILAPLANV